MIGLLIMPTSTGTAYSPSLKKEYPEKVVLLLGNHDMPYFSKYYYSLSSYHCRHSSAHHKEIAGIFDDNREMFKVAHCEGDVLFTHAGCLKGWLKSVLLEEKTASDIAKALNKMLDNNNGLRDLYMVSYLRGGYDSYGSCIWADVREFLIEEGEIKSGDTSQNDFFEIKQIFGHTIQASVTREGTLVFGKPICGENFIMLDTGNAYEIDSANFDSCLA